MMGSNIEVKLSQRAPKKPIGRLPPSISVSPDSTVEEIKKLIAKDAGIRDHNRIGLFYPSTKKTIKDRLAKIGDEKDVVDHGEMLVKDLGFQVSWRFVYIVEYFGPLLIHPLVFFLRQYLYPNIPIKPLAASVDGDLSPSQKLLFGMMMLHFLKREIETIFVHKFSASTMPAWNIFRNSAFYWFLGGLLSALDVYHPRSLAARDQDPLVNYLGLALYVFGEGMNVAVHLHLSSLRSRGGTERKIPTGLGFGLVTCPNYMYEVVAWLGMIIVSRSWAVALSIAVGILYMRAWAIGKERSYRKQFGDKYKKKKWGMLPGFF